MNARIKELIKQAGGIHYDDDNEELSAFLVDKGLEKFAELIVAECYHWAKENGGIDNDNDNDYNELKQHFGIE